MGQAQTVTRPYRGVFRRAVVAMVPAMMLGLSACGGEDPQGPAPVITDKGTPYGDLLVPTSGAKLFRAPDPPIHLASIPARLVRRCHAQLRG